MNKSGHEMVKSDASTIDLPHCAIFGAKPTLKTHSLLRWSHGIFLVSSLHSLWFYINKKPPPKKQVHPIPPQKNNNFFLVTTTRPTSHPPCEAKEMQSLSVLCAQPLGLENAGDMSAGDLRSWETQGWWVGLGRMDAASGGEFLH